MHQQSLSSRARQPRTRLQDPSSANPLNQQNPHNLPNTRRPPKRRLQPAPNQPQREADEDLRLHAARVHRHLPVEHAGDGLNEEEGEEERGGLELAEAAEFLVVDGEEVDVADWGWVSRVVRTGGRRTCSIPCRRIGSCRRQGMSCGT